jgi:CHAD domain-containing protein
MSDSSLEYLVPDGTRAGDIAALAQERWSVVEEPVEALTTTCYDTFDWALYLAGGVLERRSGTPLPMLIWQDLSGEREPLFQAAPAKPAFAADLPSGVVRAHIAGIVGIRRLLAVIGLETQVHSLRLCNEDDKTVVRLRIEEPRFRDPVAGTEGDLPARLSLLPVRGYEDERTAALTLLTDTLGLVPAERPRLLDALAAAGRRPADYTSKLDHRLDPQDRADRVAKRIHLALLEILEANLPGTRRNLDTEFLHDLRVATRRTRSLLGQLTRVFKEEDTARFKAGFAWLQQTTGPVRDLDVYLLDFDGYLANLPAQLRPHLEHLRSFLLSHYADEQRRLAHLLGSERFATLMREWRDFLEASVPEHPEPVNAARSIKAVADDRIWRLVKRVRREGRAIRPESPSEDLHELRKSCKKLRYLMEFFQSLYPEEEIRGLVRVLKILLDNLGGYQDLAVQAAHLRELAQRMRDEGQGDTDTLLAIGALIGNLLARQQAARAAFGEVFEGFLGEEHHRTFRALFADTQDGGQPT